MHRRDLLRCLGAASLLPFVPRGGEAALAFGRSAHALARRAGFRALSLHRAELVTALADLILPRSETPSAADVGVPEFIDLLLADWYEPSEAALMLKGLDAIDEMAGGSFVALDPAGREAIAARLDPLGGGDPGTAPWAWRRVKSLTVYGYFTSERVVNEVLGEPAIPGEFRGCAERRAP